MPNQGGRRPSGKINHNFLALVFKIIIIGIIGYLLFPKLFTNIYAFVKPAAAAASLNNVNLPRTYEPNIVNSSASSPQTFPNLNNTLNSGNGDNGLTTGSWILFVANGEFQQLAVNLQDYAFLQGLIKNDNKATPVATIYLVDNGQIRQYVVSKEIYSIISNLAAINLRAPNTSSNTSANSSNPPTTTPPPTAISETLTISSLSTSGFIVRFSPALDDLSISNFTLLTSSGNPITITRATTSDGGATYAIDAALNTSETYTLIVGNADYTFGTAKNIVVPQ